MFVSARQAIFAIGFFSTGWMCAVFYFQLKDHQANAPSELTSTKDFAARQHISTVNPDSSSTSHQVEIVNQISPRKTAQTASQASSSSLNATSDMNEGETASEPSLDDLWMSNDAEAWSQASQKVLKQVRELLQQGKTAKARARLDNLLRLDEKNIDALKLSALIYRKQGQALLSLNEIYRAKYAAAGSDRELSLYQDSHQWLSELAAQLMTRHDEIGLLDLYKKAVELEPDYGRHYLNLAQRYLDLGNTNDAVNSLETARFDSSISVEIDNMLAAIQHQKPVDFSDAYKIPLTQHGHQYYASVRLNGGYETTWLLDTGASVSAITPETLNNYAINVSEEGQAWFNTANGMVKGRTVVIDSLDIAGVHVDSLKVGVLDLASGGRFDGLLGMDFLRQFSFYLDQQEKILYLKNL